MAQEHSKSREYPLKAAFIYNFIKFTRWNNTDSISAAQPLFLGIVGPNYFGESLLPLEKKKASGRPISLFDCAESDYSDITKCQIVFVTLTNPAQFCRVIDVVNNRSVLTISDVEGFAQHGGCIELLEHQGKIRFIINRKAVKEQGLTLSYKVYSMALAVIGEDT